MKNKSGSRIGHLLKKIFNLRAWLDWDRMKAFTFYLYNGVIKIFTPQPVTKAESFEQAQKRLGLTDAQLKTRQNGLLRLSFIMLIMSVFLFGYAIYQALYGGILGFLLSLVVMCIGLVLAFRYHFWYFQMKHKRLGCTFHEWFREGLLGEKP